MARDTGAPLLVASLAHLVVSGPRNRRDALGRLESLGVAKLDLWSPHRTGNVNPVVVRRTFERLSGVHRAVQVFLLLAVVLSSLARLLHFQPLTLAIFLRHLLLVVSKFRLFDEVLFGVLHGTEHTLVLLG